MSVVVTGCGRSGTNIALEILRGNSHFKATEPPENKRFFHSGEYYPPEYLTKCDTHYYDEVALKTTKQLNPDLKFVWCIRDPRDMAMSKLYRGRAQGDRPEQADDATYVGLMADLDKMAEIYRFVMDNYRNDLKVVHMETSLLNTAFVIAFLCKWLGFEYDHAMENFPKRMRNKKKLERYGSGIDLSQIEMYKSWQTVYDGWFVGRKFSGRSITDIFKELEPLCKEFGYAKI